MSGHVEECVAPCELCEDAVSHVYSLQLSIALVFTLTCWLSLGGLKICPCLCTSCSTFSDPSLSPSSHQETLSSRDHVNQYKPEISFSKNRYFLRQNHHNNYVSKILKFGKDIITCQKCFISRHLNRNQTPRDHSSRGTGESREPLRSTWRLVFSLLWLSVFGGLMYMGWRDWEALKTTREVVWTVLPENLYPSDHLYVQVDILYTLDSSPQPES